MISELEAPLLTIRIWCVCIKPVVEQPEEGWRGTYRNGTLRAVLQDYGTLAGHLFILATDVLRWRKIARDLFWS